MQPNNPMPPTMGMPYGQPVPTHRPPRRPIALIVSLVITTLLLMGVAGFAFWAYATSQDYKNNTEEKVKAAVAVAVQQEGTRKDNEFRELEKQPLKTFSGPNTYGSVVLKYPKTWSGYMVEREQGGIPIDGFFHPNVVPDVQSKTAFALRIQILNKSYDDALKTYENGVRNGKVKVKAYVSKNVKGIKGSRIEGEIITGQQDTMIVLPLRDKTLQVWTESPQFLKDFDSIILENLTFVP